MNCLLTGATNAGLMLPAKEKMITTANLFSSVVYMMGE